MKTTTEIREQYNNPSNYNSVLKSYHYKQEDAEKMMRDYGKEILNHLMENLQDYIYISTTGFIDQTDEVVFNYKEISKLKNELQ